MPRWCGPRLLRGLVTCRGVLEWGPATTSPKLAEGHPRDSRRISRTALKRAVLSEFTQPPGGDRGRHPWPCPKPCEVGLLRVPVAQPPPLPPAGSLRSHPHLSAGSR